VTPILIGLLGLGLLQAANAEVRRFERLAAADLYGKLAGEQRKVEVKTKVGPEALFGEVHQVTIRASQFTTQGLPLFTEPNRSRRGRVRNLRIELADFELSGLPIQDLKADIPDCRFDLPLATRRRQIRLSQSGVGLGEVTIAERGLETFILRKFSEIKRVKVRIDRDKVFVDGYGEFLIFATDFSVIARLEPQDGDKLVLAHARILLDGKVADDATRKVLLDTLNPVVDLNRDLSLYGAIRVEKLILRDGLLKGVGTTRIPELPANLR